MKKPWMEEWRELAERTGLAFEYEPGGFFWRGTFWRGATSVEGTYRGRDLTLDTYTDTETSVIEWFFGQHGASFTRIRTSVNAPVGTELSLSKKGIFRGVLYLFVPRDILVGDGQFDQRFVIRSQPRELATHVFASSELLSIAARMFTTHVRVMFTRHVQVMFTTYVHPMFTTLADQV